MSKQRPKDWPDSLHGVLFVLAVAHLGLRFLVREALVQW